MTADAWEIGRILEPHVTRLTVIWPNGMRTCQASRRPIGFALAVVGGGLGGVWAPEESMRANAPGCCAPLATWCARSRALVWREAVNSAMRRIAFLDNEIVEVEQLIAAEALS